MRGGLGDALVKLEEVVVALKQPETISWNGLQDALGWVRNLVFGDNPLITDEVYQRYRTVTASVIARMAPVDPRSPLGVPRRAHPPRRALWLLKARR